MSNEWQSLRQYSLMGPKSGQSLNQSQQIRQMLESQQKCRRFSLNAITRNGGLTRDLQTHAEHDSNQSNQSNHTSRNTHSRSHSDTSSGSIGCITCNTSKPSKPSLNGVLTEGQTSSLNPSSSSIGIASQCNSSSSVNSSVNCTASALSGVTTTAMLPIINLDTAMPSRTSMDMTGRMSRRASRVSQESFSCSQQSILSAMDRFVKAVNNMDSTVLVPSKLRDMDLSSAKLVRVPPALANTDLHSFYLMLNDVKKELLWGPGTQHNMATSLMPFSGRSSPRDLKHIRQPSDDSLGSLGSTASSSASDQDTDSEADSLMTDKDSIDEHTSHLAAAFRHHLQGLHTILHQLADSADYLSSRYQEDIDASSL